MSKQKWVFVTSQQEARCSGGAWALSARAPSPEPLRDEEGFRALGDGPCGLQKLPRQSLCARLLRWDERTEGTGRETAGRRFLVLLVNLDQGDLGPALRPKKYAVCVLTV